MPSEKEVHVTDAQLEELVALSKLKREDKDAPGYEKVFEDDTYVLDMCVEWAPLMAAELLALRQEAYKRK